jgi:hypothetical protein
MRTNTAVTLYNRRECVVHGKRAVMFQRTVLDAVYWEPTRGARFGAASQTSNDGLLLIVPWLVGAENREYIDSVSFAAVDALTARKYWTLTEGADYVAKGIVGGAPVVDEDTIKVLLRANAEMYRIVTVNAMMFGARGMRHWEVRGK